MLPVMAQVIFKGEDYSDEAGEDFGPVFIVHNEAEPPEEVGWMPRSEAKQLAQHRGYAFEVDGMTDEELEAFKRSQG
jgi:hypothetical protein